MPSISARFRDTNTTFCIIIYTKIVVLAMRHVVVRYVCFYCFINYIQILYIKIEYNYIK